VNPLPFIDDRREKLPGLPEISKWLGDTVMIRKKTNLYNTPQFDRSTIIRPLPANTIVRIVGEMTRGYKVLLNDGTKGYIPTVSFQRYQSKSDGISKAD
jgi:hypothetical protein